MTTDLPRPRGRPRRFDPEQAVAVAQALFHARGYDAVSVADLTQAFGINPPSFYAAFGSKAGLYARVLDRYGTSGAITLEEVLRADRPVADSLAALLENAARYYAADPDAPGCLALTGVQCNDREARDAARAVTQTAEQTIRCFVAARYPAEAGQVVDFVATTMSGLSAKARDGYGPDRLLATARLAGTVLRQLLPA